MSRAVLVTLPAVFIGALLGAPSATRADVVRADGMCVVVHDHAFEVGLMDSVDPAELETADPEATPASPFDGGGTRLLCTHQNDPRCSPLQASDTPSAPDLPARPDAVLISAPTIPPPQVREVVHGESALLGPSSGPRASTYRPPRG